jgi:hypothetical protein
MSDPLGKRTLHRRSAASTRDIGHRTDNKRSVTDNVGASAQQRQRQQATRTWRCRGHCLAEAPPPKTCVMTDADAVDATAAADARETSGTAGP